MKLLLTLYLFVCSICYATTLTASTGMCGKETPLEYGYSICHDITVKYNLEKGRISTTGADVDSNITFMIRLFDEDSLRIDFVVYDLQVNKLYADSIYMVPKHLAKDVKYIEVWPDWDHYTSGRTYHCYGDDVIWSIYEPDTGKVSTKHHDKCAPATDTLKECSHTIRYFRDNKFDNSIDCLPAADSIWWLLGDTIIYTAIDASIKVNFTVDKDGVTVVNHDRISSKCPTGTLPTRFKGYAGAPGCIKPND